MSAHTPRAEPVYKAKRVERHVCENPSFFMNGSELGDIILLDCGHYWHVCWQDGGLAIEARWGRVRFWNLKSLWRIWRS